MKNSRRTYILLALTIWVWSANAHFVDLRAVMDLRFLASDFDKFKDVVRSVAMETDYSFNDYSIYKSNNDVTINIHLKNTDGMVVRIIGVIENGNIKEPIAIAFDCQGECSSWQKFASYLRKRLSMYWDVNYVEANR